MKKISIKLPALPSELIRVAIADLETVEKLPDHYLINMSDWHQPTSLINPRIRPCEVCFAGAVMAQTLKTPRTKYASPAYFPEKIAEKLRALNYFRAGYINSGLVQMSILNSDGGVRKFKNVEVVDYRFNPTKFKAQMRAIANNLKRRGL